ncbi:hypothetical protein AgCh_003390 [Apium graveolens]
MDTSNSQQGNASTGEKRKRGRPKKIDVTGSSNTSVNGTISAERTPLTIASTNISVQRPRLQEAERRPLINITRNIIGDQPKTQRGRPRKVSANTTLDKENHFPDHGQFSTLERGHSGNECSSTRRPILDMPIGSGNSGAQNTNNENTASFSRSKNPVVNLLSSFDDASELASCNDVQEILSSCSSSVKHSTGIHQENDVKEEEGGGENWVFQTFWVFGFDVG